MRRGNSLIYLQIILNVTNSRKRNTSNFGAEARLDGAYAASNVALAPPQRFPTSAAIWIYYE